MPKQNIHLFIVDAQKDFCEKTGALPVPGAYEDMERGAKMINRMGDTIDQIWSTLDCHQFLHIAHPPMWVNSKGQHPPYFTTITYDDITNGTWRAYNPRWQEVQAKYVKTLKDNGRYDLMIWPPHCLIGTPGNNLVTPIADALLKWEQKFNKVNYVAKGTNMFTEHYSALQADVPDDKDSSTKLNTGLLDVVANEADVLLCMGEALSHCMANTFRDMANNFGEDNIKKMVLLEDATSNVANCEKLGQDFIKEMKGRGMKIAKTTDF